MNNFQFELMLARAVFPLFDRKKAQNYFYDFPHWKKGIFVKQKLFYLVK